MALPLGETSGKWYSNFRRWANGASAAQRDRQLLDHALREYDQYRIMLTGSARSLPDTLIPPYLANRAAAVVLGRSGNGLWERLDK